MEHQRMISKTNITCHIHVFKTVVDSLLLLLLPAEGLRSFLSNPFNSIPNGLYVHASPMALVIEGFLRLQANCYVIQNKNDMFVCSVLYIRMLLIRNLMNVIITSYSGYPFVLTKGGDSTFSRLT